MTGKESIMNIIFDIGKVLIDFDFEGFVEKLYPPKAAEAKRLHRRKLRPR